MREMIMMMMVVVVEVWREGYDVMDGWMEGWGGGAERVGGGGVGGGGFGWMDGQ